MVGAKAITSLVLLAMGLVAAMRLDLLSAARLARLDLSAAFWAGVFGSVAGILLVRFWRLHERSETYYRFTTSDMDWEGESHFLGSRYFRLTTGHNEGDAFDFRPRTSYLIYIALGLLVGLVAVDSRAVALMREFPAKLTLPDSHTCPDPETLVAQQKEVDIPGCALVRRAYELGFAKTLGDCAPEEEEIAAAMCTMRQFDEPLLHYAWRLLDEFWLGFEERLEVTYWTRMKESFEDKADHLETLYGAQSHTMNAGPRAAHHIWTNLPPPHSGLQSLAGQGVGARDCLERFNALPHWPQLVKGDATNASQVLEHIIGQLVFDPRFSSPVGYCREYTIHWEAEPETCKELAAQPATWIAQSDARRSVKAVIDRFELMLDLEELRASAADDQDAWLGGRPSTSSPEPETVTTSAPASHAQRFVSFHCLMVEPRKESAHQEWQIEHRGYDFSVRESRVPARADPALFHHQRYAQVASLLAKGFHYGALLSEAALDAQPDGRLVSRSLAGQGFMLTRLDLLAGVDIFLGHNWVLAREDLLAVYPYHLHLQNLVDVFRRQYRNQRGRL